MAQENIFNYLDGGCAQTSYSFLGFNKRNVKRAKFEFELWIKSAITVQIL